MTTMVDKQYIESLDLSKSVENFLILYVSKVGASEYAISEIIRMAKGLDGTDDLQDLTLMSVAETTHYVMYSPDGTEGRDAHFFRERSRQQAQER